MNDRRWASASLPPIGARYILIWFWSSVNKRLCSDAKDRYARRCTLIRAPHIVLRPMLMSRLPSWVISTVHSTACCFTHPFQTKTLKTKQTKKPPQVKTRLSRGTRGVAYQCVASSSAGGRLCRSRPNRTSSGSLQCKQPS